MLFSRTFIMDLSGNVLESLKKNIEYTATKKVLELRGKPINVEDVVQIMKAGEKDFVDKMGRNMTYSEMREMFG